jgi:hypothetical protein
LYDLRYRIIQVKIAINVDGSPHFDPITEEQNMNTVFRNALLEKAGWRIFDINLVDLDANSNLVPLEAECRRIAEEINKMAPATSVVAQSETSTIISQPTLPLKQVAQTRPEKLQNKPVTTQNRPVGTHSQSISHHAQVAPVTFSPAAKKASNAKAVQSQSKSVASGHPYHFKATAATHPSSAEKHGLHAKYAMHQLSPQSWLESERKTPTAKPGSLPFVYLKSLW